MKKFLYVVYDVTEITEAEADHLCGEAMVQAEYSEPDAEFDVAGHPDVPVESFGDDWVLVPKRYLGELEDLDDGEILARYTDLDTGERLATPRD